MCILMVFDGVCVFLFPFENMSSSRPLKHGVNIQFQILFFFCSYCSLFYNNIIPTFGFNYLLYADALVC